MDAVEILLLCVVGFSVLVFLILDNLYSLEQSRKTYDSENKTRSVSTLEKSDEESVHKESEKRVGADAEAEKRLVSDNFESAGSQETSEGEETGIPVNASDEKSDFCENRGITEDDGEGEETEIPVNKSDGKSDICENRGITEDDGEGEETEIPVNKSGEKSDIFKNRWIREDDGEGEEKFIDDWVGVERSELEKIFGEAIVFVSCKSNADRIEDVKLQLYGLQKVALEGPCHGSKPMALNVSAYSKWNAWQKLGNMSREMAMKKYIDILSEAIPEWKGEGALTIQDAATFQDLSSSPQHSKYGAEAER